MTYSYEIGKDNDFGIIIIEKHKTLLVTETRKWPLGYFLNETKTYYGKQSFQRTKQWLKTNHPELIL
jgi:hypothetical protein